MLSTKQRLFMVFICILFVLNFQLDFIDQIFFKSNYLIFKSYQEDSAGIVKNCITNFILNKDFMSPLINSDGTYYLQQVALQGKLMGLFGFVFSFNVTQTILVFQLLNSILLSLVLGYLVIWSIREFGCFSGIILSFTILFSTWVIFMARNIYWVEWLMFLPIIFNLWYFRNGRNITSGYVALYFIIYFTRFCCGFEFTSSYIIAGYLSYLYYYLKNNQTHFLSRSFVMSSCVLFLIPTIAFIIAFIITLLQAYHYLGNWGSVFNVLFFNINKRIGLEKNLPGYEVYKHAMNAGYLDTILIYLKQKPIFGETVDGFKESYFDFINFLYTAYFLSILNMKCISKCKAKRSLLIVSLISVLAPLSWYILGKPHSFWHTHINTILLFIPTIFLQAILIAVCIRDLIGHIKAKVSKLFIR